MANISSVVSKKFKFKISIFDPFLGGRDRKKKFSRIFFKTMLEMFSVLKYIGQKENLAEKNNLGVIDRLENSKNQRKTGFLSFGQGCEFLRLLGLI
jgi:hypothetical protein